ncbi:MAG: endolytic transglycosylase MltG [Alphaproteobacteria bacterium]|nr:endolytic transglycosylase MltG [Alphaproteobacteria bacterium]
MGMGWLKRILHHKLFVFIALLIVLPSIITVYLAYWIQHPQKNEKTTIFIEKGASLSQIAQTLKQYEVLNSPLLFKAVVYVTGAAQKLKAGEYLIPPSITPAQLIHILKSGEVILHGITLIEGETCHRLVEKIASNTHFQGACETPEEGILLPETYHFPHGTECYIILDRMKKAMTHALEVAWAERCDNHPLGSPQELLVLASIIEKESSKASEKPLVAAVFLNRLKQGMPLQADPTVIYALTNGREGLGRALFRGDLKFESPYNTYLYRGLPPTPIANPSLSSLKAAAHPANVAYFYFVADGSGGHAFSETLGDHQKHHATWRKIRDKK